MKDFLEKDGLVKPGKKYEDFYRYASSKGIKFHNLFVFLATIGFSNNRREEIIEAGGIEFRWSFLDDKGKLALYTILLNSKDEEIEFDELFKNERYNEYRTLLIEYAAGGLEYILEEYLPTEILVNPEKKYTSYNLLEEIAKITYQELNKVPF